MRDTFPDRMKARTELLERASHASGMEFDQEEMDAIFGARESSSVNVVVDDEPGMQVVHRVLMEGKQARRRRALLAGVVAVLAALGLAAGAVRAILSAEPNDDATTATVATAMPVAGQARVTVRPLDAKLVMDDTPLVGPGPYVLSDLDPGIHKLVATAPGFERAKEDLEVTAGEVALLDIALKPLPPARLVVTTTPPGATVLVDGTAIGLTPFKLDSLRPEVEHSLKVTRDGYLPAEENVRGGPGEEVTRDFRLDPVKSDAPVKPTGRLFLSTSPWSIVYYGKRKLGETPLLGVRLPAGKLTLRAENPKTGQKKTFTVDITKGKDTRLSLKL